MQEQNQQNDSINRILALIFLSTLSILFLIGAIISFPKKQPINIAQKNIKNIQNDVEKGNWFVLNAKDYKVVNHKKPFAEFKNTNSTYLTSETYYYFNVLVKNQNNENFIMAIRTKNKILDIQNGKNINLYGMVLRLNKETKEKQLLQLKEYNYKDIPILFICLNDNDDTKESNYGMFFMFLIMAIISKELFNKILKKEKIQK